MYIQGNAVNLSSEDRSFVSTHLTDNSNPSEEEIHHLADELLSLHHDAVAQRVREMVGEYHAALALQERYRQLAYFPLLSPVPDQGELLGHDAEGNEMRRMPARTPYKLHLVDLPAFCKEFGLNEQAMFEVGMGQRKEHKGWRRGSGFGGQHEQGQSYREPIPVQPQPARRARRTILQPAVEPPTVQYTPSTK